MYSINRNAVVIKPKQPFIQWLKSVPGDNLNLSIDELQNDRTVILIPEFPSEREAIAYIESLYEVIFEMELYSWYRDERLWPKNRSLEMFRKWLDVEIHSEVFDVLDEEIEKEI